MPKVERTKNSEVCCMGVMAISIDKRSTIIGRVIITKATRMRSILVELTRRKRVMMLILHCLVIVGQP